MLTVKGVADLVGLSASTVRAWEARYGVLQPERSPAGYRLYSEHDVAALRSMKALVDLGWPPSSAAKHTRRLRHAGQDLVEAAIAFDCAGAVRLFDERLALGSFEHVVDTWLMPALVGVGKAWARGEVDVASEHAIASALQRRLSAAFDAAAHDGPGTVQVLTGLPSGSRHELGILTFATCLRRRGVKLVHLGSDLPVDSWANACERYAPALTVLAAPMREDVAGVLATASRLETLGVRVVVGGCHQQDVAAQNPAVLALGHSIPAAAAQVAQIVGQDHRQ
jgi:DNA-binding transcriptional MerR regulator